MSTNGIKEGRLKTPWGLEGIVVKSPLVVYILEENTLSAEYIGEICANPPAQPVQLNLCCPYLTGMKSLLPLFHRGGKFNLP